MRIILDCIIKKAQIGAKFNFRRNKGILVATEINTIFEYSF